MNEKHIVLLIRQILSLLDRLKRLSGYNERLFPGDPDPKKVMSENTMNIALHVM